MVNDRSRPPAAPLEHVVVVGASLAGLRAVETLRTDGFDGAITVIGAEAHLPYDRPPLSKKLLAGEWEPERITLRKPDDLGSLAVTWRLGVPAAGLDVVERLVHLADGGVEHYDGLVIATGASPRRLPGQPLPPTRGLHELRTLDDSLALRAELRPDAQVVVIGAGFIGLEVAATARQAGAVVTVLEGLPAPLVRALGAEMGAAVAAVHDRNGVTIRCGVQVQNIEVDDAQDRVVGVRLGDGELVRADVVVVGIGVAPNTAWLEDTDGIDVRDGVVCDATLAAGPPGVFAAGDLVRWPNHAFGPVGVGEEMRVEHWTNAAEQGAAAARNLLASAHGDEGQPYAAVPFFWSDQFDARVQFLGRATGGDEVEVVAGDPPEGRFVALYGRDGMFRGALGVSMPKLVMPMRKLLLQRASWDEALDHARSLAG
jgi:NADPH-dependent 2,4-dienoyl-CoA reductase/sulfur reductase-like enzyme